MDHVYSVFCPYPRDALNHRFSEWVSESRCLSSISNSNLLAFSSLTDLKEEEPKTQSINVYVIDLNIPYSPYLVTSHTEQITSLEWDISGTKLLIGDTLGNVSIWAMKDHLINDWYLFHSQSCFFGEIVLASIWFHNGNKVGINPEKKNMIASYSEKFISVKFGASVRQFGNKPANGCLCISSCGLVSCIILLSDGSIVTGTETLGQFRSKLKVIDVCYAKNGDFLVVTSNGSVKSSVNCYKVSVKVNSGQEKSKCTINCQPFSSFYLDCSQGDDNNVVTHLKFVLKEAADAVVVAASGSLGSVVELWELREKPVSLHRMFQAKASEFGTTQPKTVVWQHHASVSHNQNVVAIATPHLSLYDINPLLSQIVVAYGDHIIKCFYRENLQEICRINVASSCLNVPENSKAFNLLQSSNSNSVTNITDMQFTFSGSILIALDTASQVSLYRLPPVADLGASNTVSSIQTMLEYCLITGNDWWDVLICVRPELIEIVCDTFTEAFTQKQPPSVQHKWLSRFLTMKASFYRCLIAVNTTSSGRIKSGDCYAMIMLHAISNLLKSLLRARESQEKDGPAENLSVLMQSKGNETQYFNVDKVLLDLQKTGMDKEFFVEPSILQSLQHLNQWIGDTTLYLLASLPQQCHNRYRFPGGGLILEAKSVNTLRELLVIIRIWGLINESSLPVFTTLTSNKMGDNFDVIAHLFKLLTKTVAAIGAEPDESLIEECCLLPNQVLVPQLDFTMKAIGVASPPLFTVPHPMIFRYNYEPEFLNYETKTYTLEGAVVFNAGRKIDAVRHVSLGHLRGDVSNIRCCTRCTAVSLIQLFMKSPAIKAWDQRWFKNCLCGGNWRIKSRS